MNLPRLIEWLARALAIAGGLVLVAITILTVISVIGRFLNRMGLGPVPGDFEMVEAGTGFAVFAFLPWCQLNRGHASVDLFTNMMSAGANRVIEVLVELLMTAVVILIAWRLWAGFVDKFNNGETTFILQFPLWWAYAPCIAAAAVGVLVSVYVLVMRAVELRSGRTILEGQGVVH
jgi:TRAP-type C4-dicarboxylate transport system permease small subunit